MCIVIMCIFAQGVELNVKFVKNVFISLLEMSKVNDLVGQPSFKYKSLELINSIISVCYIQCTPKICKDMDSILTEDVLW